MGSDPLLHLLLWRLARNDVEVALQHRLTVQQARRVNVAGPKATHRWAAAWLPAHRRCGGRP
jgi:hypothetical protein